MKSITGCHLDVHGHFIAMGTHFNANDPSTCKWTAASIGPYGTCAGTTNYGVACNLRRRESHCIFNDVGVPVLMQLDVQNGDIK